MQSNKNTSKETPVSDVAFILAAISGNEVAYSKILEARKLKRHRTPEETERVWKQQQERDEEEIARHNDFLRPVHYAVERGDTIAVMEFYARMHENHRVRKSAVEFSHARTKAELGNSTS
jgi:hypothetical protein